MTDIQILDKIKLMVLEQTTSTEKYVKYAEVLDKCKKLLEEHTDDERWTFLDFPRNARIW